jgi:hypothetical protein
VFCSPVAKAAQARTLAKTQPQSKPPGFVNQSASAQGKFEIFSDFGGKTSVPSVSVASKCPASHPAPVSTGSFAVFSDFEDDKPAVASKRPADPSKASESSFVVYCDEPDDVPAQPKPSKAAKSNNLSVFVDEGF